MNISEGIYRGFKIVINLIPGTSGQIAVSVATPNKEIGEALTAIGEKNIRKIIKLPEENNSVVEFWMLDKKENGGDYGFQWIFLFNHLSGKMTKYEFLASTFRVIDELIELILAKLGKTNSENKPE